MRIALLLLLGLIAYVCFWPVAISPVAWQAPIDQLYVGAFEKNDFLDKAERIALQQSQGPEDIVMDEHGALYSTLENGDIIKFEMNDDGSFTEPQTLVNIDGRVLGMRFDQHGDLILADAFFGLRKLTKNGDLEPLLSEVNGEPLVYANNLDISQDGVIYFSEASNKFSAKENGGTFAASLLDLMEHGGHGRVFAYRPHSDELEVLASGLSFANGVALSHDEQSLYIVETGEYRILRLHLMGDKKGQIDVHIDNLPGFPDNITRGLDGRYWFGLVSPRNKIVDALSDKPFVRKMIQRLPAFVRPTATLYGHVLAINDQGDVVQSLQSPSGYLATTTGAFEAKNALYIASLKAQHIGVLALPTR